MIPSSCVLATEAVRRRPSLASSTSSSAAVVALHVPLTIHEARMRRWWSLAPTHWPRRQFVRQSHQYRFSNGPPSTARAHQGTARHDVARWPAVSCLVVPSCPTISPNTAPMGTQQCRVVPKGTSGHRATPCQIEAAPRVVEETELPVAPSSSPLFLSQQTEAVHPHRLHGVHVAQGPPAASVASSYVW